MKLRKGFRAIGYNGTVWYGDCPKWADVCRKAGMKVEPMRILGFGIWECVSCDENLSH